MDWAGFLKRTFDFNVLACARGGGRLKGTPWGLGPYTSLAHCSGGPCPQPFSAPQLHPSPSTSLPFCLCALAKKDDKKDDKK